MIRILIVDDQHLVRTGIRSLLELSADFSVVGEATDGHEALLRVPELKPDVLLLDVRLPGLSGIEVVEKLHAQGQLPPTLLLTTFDDDAALRAGIRAGARGFLLKDISFEVLQTAIRRLHAGESLFLPAQTERAQAMAQAKAASGTTEPGVTRREAEILRLLAAGWSNKEVARALGTSEGTVKNHVSSILAKLGVRDRTRAVLKAMQMGFI